MAIPVILAEFIAVTELYILFKQDLHGTLKQLNRVAGTIVGLYFVGIFLYLLINNRSRKARCFSKANA